MTTPETPESEDANMNKCPMCGHVSEAVSYTHLTLPTKA